MAHRWYVLHVYSGFERKVADSIREQAASKGMEDLIPEVLVPTEEVVEVRRGQKVSSERKFFPGYVLIKMELNDESWHLVKNTPKVTGFLGGRQARAHLSVSTEPAASGARGLSGLSPRSLRGGRAGSVADGPFMSFNGVVEEVDEGGRLKVAVSISVAPPSRA